MIPSSRPFSPCPCHHQPTRHPRQLLRERLLLPGLCWRLSPLPLPSSAWFGAEILTVARFFFLSGLLEVYHVTKENLSTNAVVGRGKPLAADFVIRCPVIMRICLSRATRRSQC
jgi:hypothetical protein